MGKNYKSIVVLNQSITVTKDDYISLTDMLKSKDGNFFISDWLRNRNTLEYLGVWERIHNPDFNYGEFATIKSQAGLNSYKKGNIRDYANVSQLVCLVNLENLNAVFINEGLSQSERLQKLNQIAIAQMKILVQDHAVKMLDDENGGGDEK